MILRGAIVLDSDVLPSHGSVVGDREVNALVDLEPRAAARWIAARVRAWRSVHRKHSIAGAGSVAAWPEVRRG